MNLCDVFKKFEIWYILVIVDKLKFFFCRNVISWRKKLKVDFVIVKVLLELVK